MKKILITGFEPFGTEKLNPSRELALSFQSWYDTLVLPVSYKRAFEEIRPRLEVGGYDLVLMLGQAGGRQWVELERVAINLEDSLARDEDGDLRIQTKISSLGPDAFLNPLPLRDFVQELQTQKNPVQISFSAGAFVCNSLYYRVFEWIKENERSSDVLFVHLPFFEMQLEGKPEATPYLPLAQMKGALEGLIELMQG